MKLYETSFLYALIRFIGIAILFYAIKKTLKNKREYLFSDFLMTNISKYTSFAIIVVFFLTQVKAYNLFNFLCFVFIFFVFDLNNFNHPKIIYDAIVNTLDRTTTNFISFIEAPAKKQIITHYITSSKLTKNEVYDLVSVLAIVVIAFIIRMSFYTNDLFLFSESWFADFEKITHISNQKWFTVDYTEMGEYALINLFGSFFKISAGMSLQMYGLFQCTILSILIYWVVKQSSCKDYYFIPLLAASLFLGGLTITPIDLAFLFKHRKIFTVLIIFIPVLILLLQKQHYYRYRNRLFYFSTTIVALGFLMYASIFMLVLPSIILLLIFDATKNTKQKITLTLLLILLAVTVVLVYFLTFDYGLFNLTYFLKNSCIEISNFSKIDNLYFPYDNVVQVATFLATIVTVINVIAQRTNVPSILISLLYLIITTFYRTEHTLIDRNLFLLLFSVLTPMLIGISINTILFNNIKFIGVKVAQYTSLILLIISAVSLVHIQKPVLKTLNNSNETNRQLLSTYDHIIAKHLPYSYAVVNHQKAYPFSRFNHFFMNYEDMNTDYLVKDSVFHSNKSKKDFLKNNPQAILPNSIFLFEILGVDKNISRIGFLTDATYLKQNDSILKVLKSRNRQVILYSNTDRLRVYKIVNKPNSSNIDKMLFYDKRL